MSDKTRNCFDCSSEPDWKSFSPLLDSVDIGKCKSCNFNETPTIYCVSEYNADGDEVSPPRVMTMAMSPLLDERAPGLVEITACPNWSRRNNS